MTGMPRFVTQTRIVTAAVFRCASATALVFAIVHGLFQIPGYDNARRMASTMTAPRPRLFDHFGVALEAATLGAGLLLVPVLFNRRLVPCPASGCPSCGYDLSANPARCPECGLLLSPPDLP